jgi:hypothetical protein
MPKGGRPQKPYQTSWNVPIAGLARDPDGRWRVVATGKRFTEHDERRAVARFYDMTRAARVERMTIPVSSQVISRNGKPLRRSGSLVAMDRLLAATTTNTPITILLDRLNGTASASQDVNSAILADWLREQLTEQPGFIANLVGIPELISLRNFDIPKAPITVYPKGARPVVYEKLARAKEILPAEEYWRIVNLDLSDENAMIDWTHEREWRVPGEKLEFDLPEATVILPNADGYEEFRNHEVTKQEDLVNKIAGIIVAQPVFY